MKRFVFLESNLSGSGVQALRLAREEGHHVTFVTRDLGRYLSTIHGAARIFRECVHEVVECDTSEVEPVLSAISGRRIDAFLAIGEYHVRQAAEIARRIGVPGAAPEAVRVARDKRLTRERCAGAGLPMPAFRAVARPGEVAAAVEAVGLPCVVKPVDEASSVDVLACHTVEAATAHAARLLGEPRNTRGFVRPACVLVEECLAGIEVSVEILVHRRRIAVLGVTDKRLAGAPFFVEVGHAFPTALPAHLAAGCSALATRALEAIGYDFGAAHVEVKLTGRGPRLIEVNARAGGDRIPDLVEHSLGIHTVRQVIRMHAGEEPDLVPTRSRGSAIRFLAGTPGRAREVLGLEAARRAPGIVELHAGVAAGDEVRPLRCSHDRIGHAIAVAESSSLADRLAEAALGQVVVRVTAEGAS